MRPTHLGLVTGSEDKDCAGAGALLVAPARPCKLSPEHQEAFEAWVAAGGASAGTPAAPDMFRSHSEETWNLVRAERAALAELRRPEGLSLAPPEFVHDDSGTMIDAQTWIANGGERFWEKKAGEAVERALGSRADEERPVLPGVPDDVAASLRDLKQRLS